MKKLSATTNIQSNFAVLGSCREELEWENVKRSLKRNKITNGLLKNIL